jgi:DNA gyrase subunit B
MLARAEILHRTDITSKSENEIPPKLVLIHTELAKRADEFGFKELGEPLEDEEHHTWSISFTDAQGATRHIDWVLASSPEFRQMMSKYVQIKQFLEPPFVIEFATKAAVVEASPEVGDEEESDETENAEDAAESAQVKTESKQSRRANRVPRDPVEKQTARELFAYIVEQGKKDYQVQRYKGLGEMTSTQLWDTTMDPEKRTLLSVKLEDLAETDAIFTVLMGEDVDSRRKFIEDNALDVKNLDI